jgi:protein-S-isoprenylcysteine O-methyltransferase Ste14
MATLALMLWSLFGLLAVGLRVALQVRRTGETGLRRPSGEAGSVEWLASVGFVASVALGVAAPVLALADVVEPIEPLDTTAVHAIGLALYGAGLAAVLIAQGSMGSSWRIGVDPSERTGLVTDGPFTLVRNPIFTAMLAVTSGLALLVPSTVALASVALLLGSLELHTRAVEEPYLLRTHGAGYSDYAARVGRFLPGIGRLVNR